MAQVSLYQQFRAVCSSDRVDSYRSGEGETEIDVFARYVWNTTLCESLYPSLQNLEIGLRNRLNDALASSYGYDEWYTDTSIVLDVSARNKVIEAKQLIQDEGKTVTPSRVVSELSLGFWTSLFSAQHHEAIWERPGLLKDAFPYMPKTIRKRSTLAGRFGEARKLRNRIFHFEPIWRRANLAGEHANVIEALGWLDPCLQKVTAAIDRFKEVNTQDHRDLIRDRLVRACPVESKLLIASRRSLATEEVLVSAK